VWDANETWLIVAVAAMFAAFPAWYAATFSTFYLPVLVILCALIVRGLAFEYRGKGDDPAWRRRWDACIIVGSVLPPLLWGVFFANLVRGVPLDKEALRSFPWVWCGLDSSVGGRIGPCATPSCTAICWDW
jgi:cytochrome d ubiquinol oxidase subunit II